MAADVVRCWAAFASLGAGLIHFAVVREHFSEWWVYGVFFTVTGAAQVLWALAALAAERVPFPRLVALANVAMVALWAVTRTTGLPFGPEPGEAEAVGRADVLCVVLEIAVACLAIAAARLVSRPRVSTSTRSARAGQVVALMFAGALAVSAVTTPALAATEAGHHAHHH